MQEFVALLDVVKLPVELLLVVLLLMMNQKITRLGARLGIVEDRLKIRYPAALLSALALCFVFLLSGCLQFDPRGIPEDAGKGAAIGGTIGGPVGAAIGAVVAAVAGGFAAHKNSQCRRRDRIINHYRGKHGDIDAGTLSSLKA
jgi:hypothetical protein